MEWNPESYAKFEGLRQRPALDLMAQVPTLPSGDIVDLGCGSGFMATALKARFKGRLVGVDNSASMLEKAAKSGEYDALIEENISNWRGKPVLIFSNAALHWLPDHKTFFPRLAEMLPVGGVLAVQMPRQFDAPSHALLREVATTLFPSRFDYTDYTPPVSPPERMAIILAPHGVPNILETSFLQSLPAGEGHPVRAFTQSTAARPVLNKLNTAEQRRFLNAYDEALNEPYPLAMDGSVHFPFLRQFIILVRKR